MVQPHSAESREQVVETMIGLTRLSSLQRTIVAGSDRMELYLALRRRGFMRVATPATCRIPRGQHAIGLIAGQDTQRAIEAALAEISPFLCTHAAVAVLIELARKWLQPQDPDEASADGFPDRSRGQVPAGSGAFRVPARFRPDGKRSVNSDDTPCKFHQLAHGLHARSADAVR